MSMKKWIACMLAFCLLLGSVALQEFSQGKIALRWFNPVELIIPRDIIWRDTYVNVFSQPVRLYVVVMNIALQFWMHMDSRLKKTLMRLFLG